MLSRAASMLRRRAHAAAVHLRDYAPPPFRVRHHDLAFDLDPLATRVHAKVCRAQPPRRGGSLAR
jgi:aminopeptidase N